MASFIMPELSFPLVLYGLSPALESLLGVENLEMGPLVSELVFP